MAGLRIGGMKSKPATIGSGESLPGTCSSWSGRELALLVLAVLVLITFRLAAFSAPLEVDECNYGYFGRQLSAGDELYVDLWDHQPPGVYSLTTMMAWTVGVSPFALRGAATIAAVLTLIVFYTICRRHVGKSAALLAVAVFAITSSDPGVAGEGCNREIYMNLLGVLAVWLLASDRRAVFVLAAGTCLGISSLFKTVVAAQWLLLCVALLIDDRSWRDRIASVLLFAVGPLAVWLCTFLYFFLTNRLEPFVDAAFVYNLTYGGVDTSLWRKLAGFFGSQFVTVFRSASVLWISGFVGIVVCAWRRRRSLDPVLLAYFVGSFAAVCLPGKFWHHYYMLMLPSLVLGSAVVLAELNGIRSQRPARRSVWWGYVGCVLVVLFLSQALFYLLLEPDYMAFHRYRDRMGWGRDHGFRIAAVTDPHDHVYVGSIDVGMYYYSSRRCATRFTMATMLTADDPQAAERQEIFARELRENRPRLILIIDGAPYMPELDKYIKEVGYVWAGSDPGRLTVLCDPKRPIRNIDWNHSLGEDG